MLHTRLYRAGLPIVLISLLVALFSVVSRPDPLEAEPLGAPFDEGQAAADAAGLLTRAPERRPGSEGDRDAVAWLVEQMEQLEGGSVETDSFQGRLDDTRVEMTNVIHRLPGETDELVIVAAPRGCEAGPCAASSASSTAVLLGLARTLAATHHRKTLILASTGGTTNSPAGTTRLSEQLESEDVSAVVVLTNSGVREPSGRTVVPWSTTTGQTSVQLLLTAEEAVAVELDREEQPPRSSISELVRLGLPAGLGAQAPLVGAGVDAIGLSGHGTRSLGREEDESFYPQTLAAMGRTGLGLVRTLDAGPATLVHGPSARIPLAGKLLPGWALALVSASLLVPLVLTSLGFGIRAAREELEVYPAIRWVVSRIAPFAGALALLVLLAALGLVGTPKFPFDPLKWQLTAGPILVLLVLAGCATGAYVWIRSRIPVPESGVVGVGAVGAGLLFGGVLTWIVNPYLALLLGPSLHLWLWAGYPGLPGGRSARRWMTISGVALALGPVFVLGEQLGSGIGSSVWQLALMFVGGHFPLSAAIPILILAGCVLALFEAVAVDWTDVRTDSAHVSAGHGPIGGIHHGRKVARNRWRREPGGSAGSRAARPLRPVGSQGRRLDSEASGAPRPVWDQAGPSSRL